MGKLCDNIWRIEENVLEVSFMIILNAQINPALQQDANTQTQPQPGTSIMLYNMSPPKP